MAHLMILQRKYKFTVAENQKFMATTINSVQSSLPAQNETL